MKCSLDRERYAVSITPSSQVYTPCLVFIAVQGAVAAHRKPCLRSVLLPGRKTRSLEEDFSSEAGNFEVCKDRTSRQQLGAGALYRSKKPQG